MTEREELVALLADNPASPTLLNFLGKSRADLEAMPDDDLYALVEPAAAFQHESGTLTLRLADIMNELATLKQRPCLVNDLAHREQRMRDLCDEYNRLARRLVAEFFIDPETLTPIRRERNA